MTQITKGHLVAALDHIGALSGAIRATLGGAPAAPVIHLASPRTPPRLIPPPLYPGLCYPKAVGVFPPAFYQGLCRPSVVVSGGGVRSQDLQRALASIVSYARAAQKALRAAKLDKSGRLHLPSF